MKHLIYLFIILFAACSTGSSSFEKAISGYRQTDPKTGRVYDLRFKMIEMGEAKKITVADSIKILEEDFRMENDRKMGNYNDRLAMDKKNLEKEKSSRRPLPVTIEAHEKIIREYEAKIAEAESAKPDLGKYATKAPDEVLGYAVTCTYSMDDLSGRNFTEKSEFRDDGEATLRLLVVQFDFPNKEGKPYKSSGGAMKWDKKLNRNIPEDWHCGNLFQIAVFTNGLACQKYRPQKGEKPLPVIKIREMHDGIMSDTEEVTPNIPESVKVYNGDVLFSWSASLEVMLWAYGLGGLNQHIFKVTSANGFPKSFYYFQLLDHVDIFKKMAEARKTTMGHITQDHLQQSTIAIPDNKSITDKFEQMVSPIFGQIIRLQEEISNLTKQRNELLPLLMNGQITIE